MRKIIYLLLLLSISFGVTAQNQVTKDYVQKYKGIAIREMKRTGIPASITLAQGILESASGESNLSKKFNNHFGIKCKTEWKGPSTYQDDDTKNECFRVYPDADSSYRDHSNFLKYRPYYASLFELDPVDDTAWAYGLKKAGYATERDYPSKLLKIIDDYELAQYNYPELVAEDSINLTKAETNSPEKLTITTEKPTVTPENPIIVESTPIQLNKVNGINTSTVANTPAPVMKGLGEIPIDTIKPKATEKQVAKTKPNYPLNQKFRINQVPAIWAEKGRSILEIANTYNIPLYKIYKFNELAETDLMEQDQIVFLAEKKKESNKKIHVAKAGETFYEISQTEGIQLLLLKAYNPILTDATIKEGAIIYMFNSPKEAVPNATSIKPVTTAISAPKTTSLPTIKTTDTSKSKANTNKIKSLIQLPFLKHKN